MPLAEEQALEFDLPQKLAVAPFEGFAHRAPRVRGSGSVCDLFVWHEDHFP
jgi:hypothetical protein